MDPIGLGSFLVIALQTPADALAAVSVEEMIRQRSCDSLQRWAENRPWDVADLCASRVRGILQAAADRDSFVEDAFREQAWFLIDCLTEAPAPEWLALTLEWDDDQLREVHELGRQLPGLDHQTLAGWQERAESLNALPLFEYRLSRLANRLFQEGHRSLADELAEQLLFVAEDVESGLTLAWSLHWLARVSWRRGDFEESQERFQRSRSLWQALDDDREACLVLQELSSLQLVTGDLTGALQSSQDALQEAHRLTDWDTLQRAVEIQASILQELGEPAAAYRALLSLDEVGQGRESEPETRARRELMRGTILSDLGQETLAEQALQRAAAAAAHPSAVNAAPELAWEVQLSLGLLLGDLGHTEAALSTLQTAEKGFLAGEDPRGAAWAWKNRGWVLQRAGRFEEAMEWFARATDYGKEHSLPFLEGWCALGQAECAVDLGELPESFGPWLQVAQERGRQLDDNHLRWRTSAAFAEGCLLRGDLEEALIHLRLAVKRLESLRQNLEVPTLMTHFLRHRADPYRRAASVAARLGSHQESFRYADLLCGRILAESRSRQESPVSFSKAVSQLRRQEKELVAKRRDPATDQGALDSELVTIRHALREALVRDELQAPRQFALRGLSVHSVDCSRLQERIGELPFETLIEYLVLDDKTLVYEVREDDFRVHTLDIGRTELKRLVARLREPIEKLRAGQIDLAHLGFDGQAARELYERLVGPLRERWGSRVAIVPDGPLWSVPFDALVTAGKPGPLEIRRPFSHLQPLQFLAEELVISIVPAAAVLAWPPSTPPVPPQTVPPSTARRNTIGYSSSHRQPTLPPLVPSTEASFSPPVLHFAPATRQDILGTAGQARVLHFFAHGFIDRDVPQNSHLLFRDEQGRPDPLRSWEIERLPLTADLTILSACHSGEGAYLPGEGLLGLTRSFLLAGSRRVVASLWAVEEESTLRLLELFQEALARGMEPGQALQRAKLELRRTMDPRGFSLAHPYFWAGWVLHTAG